MAKFFIVPYMDLPFDALSRDFNLPVQEGDDMLDAVKKYSSMFKKDNTLGGNTFVAWTPGDIENAKLFVNLVEDKFWSIEDHIETNTMFIAWS